MGSGSASHEERASALGAEIAELGAHLLTGGGRGVMESVSRAFCHTPDRKGLVIGVMRSAAILGRTEEGYPNEWVELPIHTHLSLSGESGTDPMSRNHINVLSSDVIVALPGGSGTASEVELAVRYGKPIIAFVPSAKEIPALPAEVPISNDLDTVMEFVGGALACRQDESGGGSSPPLLGDSRSCL